jgi:CheY-like chemotaxis protein
VLSRACSSLPTSTRGLSPILAESFADLVDWHEIAAMVALGCSPARLGGIDASRDPRPPLAQLCGFLLASMCHRGRYATMATMPTRCLIVDDNDAFLAAARTLLERQGLTVAGVASTSAEALRDVETLRPDLVLVDVSLGPESGLDLARQLVDEPSQAARVILISTRSETELSELVALSPALGFLSKSDLSADAIRGLLNRSEPAS